MNFLNSINLRILIKVLKLSLLSPYVLSFSLIGISK